MSKKFIGDLEYIDPNLLVTHNENNKTESFFLGLGLVFNDLKGILFFEKLLIDTYEKPAINEVSTHAGNYGGIMVQIQKLTASIISEFFIFLKKNGDVLSGHEFEEILKRLSKSDQQLWRAVIAAAHGKFPSATRLLDTAVKIRSNISFHYDHSGKILKNGFKSRFFGNFKDKKSQLAYYSIGNNIENTRFFFSDAAAEEALYLATGKQPKETSVENIQLIQYRKEIIDTINVMGLIISSLIKNYIQVKRNRPH